METKNTLLIKNAKIIDGTGKPPYEGSVVIEDNLIKHIEKSDTKQLQADQIIDAKGLFLLPGMIDCHVHVMFNNYKLMQHLHTPFSLNFYHAIANLKSLLHAGITSARDAGGADFGVKKAIELGLIEGPKLKISITPLSITGGHLDAWLPSGITLHLLSPPYPGSPASICDGPREVRKRVREILRAGADVIKVCSTGGVLSPTDHPDFTQFSSKELSIMVEEGAMRKGIKVMAHAQGLQGIKNAIKAGVHSIEHGVTLDQEAIDLMLKNKVFLVPTLLAIHSVIDGEYPQAAKDKAKEIFETHQKSIAKAYEQGVQIAMGTDSGIMQHGRNLEELQLMCNLGITPMDAIVASTKTAAACLQMENKVGTIEENKIADLILVQKNPLEDIHSLSNNNTIKVILKDGKIVKNSM
ncbi:amidohydrolase family protein [Tenacibaculum sp. nBUS_03]|uniref:metal-dependent hydrolase family protein n=1 Tax=Tenacibaculum sp. nBUS_03 TaxID=3395320 RepID=UPI003EB7E024